MRNLAAKTLLYLCCKEKVVLNSVYRSPRNYNLISLAKPTLSEKMNKKSSFKTMHILLSLVVLFLFNLYFSYIHKAKTYAPLHVLNLPANDLFKKCEI